MSNMLRISEAATLALHTVGVLQGKARAMWTTRAIARTLGVSEAHLSKVLQRLAKAGVVRSVRGPKGGFALAKSGDEVTLLDVYEAIDGKLEPTRCLFGRRACDGNCIVGDLVAKVNTLVEESFSKTKVSEITRFAN